MDILRIDDVSEEEFIIRQDLQNAGFFDDDQKWLVQFFKHRDTFGNSSSATGFRDGFADNFGYVLPKIVEQLSKPVVQTEKDRQTCLALLFSSLLGFGPLSGTLYPNVKPVKSNGSWNMPPWVSAYQKYAKFCAKSLDWRKLIEFSKDLQTPFQRDLFQFDDLFPFLFPEGVPLDQVPDLDLDVDSLDDLFPFLFPEDVPLEQIIDLDLLDPIPQRESSINDFRRNPKRLEFWLIWRVSATGEHHNKIRQEERYNAMGLDPFSEVLTLEEHKDFNRNVIRLDTLLQFFFDFPADILGDKILGLLNAIEYALNITEKDLNCWLSFRNELPPFLELLNEKQPNSNQEQSSLLKAWWRLAMVVYLATNKISDELRNQLVESAVKYIGILQKMLKDTPEDFKDKDSTGAPISDFYDKAFEVLCTFASPWKRLKPLLQVFTEMTRPAVPYDLHHLHHWPEIGRESPTLNSDFLSLRNLFRPWPEAARESLLQPYCKIPIWVENAINILLVENPRCQRQYEVELKKDPSFHGLREEFAKFCLERLKKNKNGTKAKNRGAHYTDDNFVEHRPLWRQCYVQALVALRVDLEGQTHETLFWLSENDPNKTVREFAKKAHKEFAEKVHEGVQWEANGWTGLSQLLPFEAFWWLRQAHRLTLRPPRDDSQVLSIKQGLQDAGFPDADQEWLVQIFERPDCFGDSNGISMFKPGIVQELPGIAQELTRHVQIGEDRQTRLALLFSFLIGFGPVDNEVVRPNIECEGSGVSRKTPPWVNEFQRHARFCAQSLDWHKLIEIKGLEAFLSDNLISFLFPEGVPLEQVVDLDLLDLRQGPSKDFRNPKRLELWLIWRFFSDRDRVYTIRLEPLLQKFSSFPADILGDKILGLLDTIKYAWNIARNDKRRDDRVVGQELLPLLELLNEKQPDSNQDRSSALKAWWRLTMAIYDRTSWYMPSHLTQKNQLVKSAARHIGILRSVLRDTPKVFEDKDSAGTISDFYREAFYILLNFAPPWKCLKPLLLVFTTMTVQAVTPDLRPWPESGREHPPHPYNLIPLWIGIAMYPLNLRTELDKDSYLQGLREEFAKFCLERLKTKGKKATSSKHKQFTDEDFVEPRPAWRQGYVQALAALRVNPGGRAHRTLFWLSQNDPNEAVRDLAKRAHKRIRHLDRKKPNLDKGASPRRPLFEAFWWLRRAHLVTLGIEIDQVGAMRTRRRELHRTREMEDIGYPGEDDTYTDRFFEGGAR